MSHAAPPVALPSDEQLARWPGRERREPRVSDGSYLVLRHLATSISNALERTFPDRTDLRVLDVGCGDKPYLPLVAHRAASYRGIDSERDPHVDDVGSAQELPYPDGSFDLVLCTQVLEHLPEPSRAVGEIARVLAPGGVALVSTHGMHVFHPDPPGSGQDYWRWTHAGLERLFATSGSWSDIAVEPHGDVVACLTYIVCWYLQGLPAWLSRPAIATLNAIARFVDPRFPGSLRVPAPGSLSANYLVVARRAQG